MSGILSNFAMAYLSPRQSAAIILSRADGMRTALLLFALAYVLSQIFVRLTPGYRLPEDVSPVSFLLLDLMLMFLVFLVLSALVYSIGRMAGGQGSRVGAHVIVAWHSVVISPFAILQHLWAQEVMAASEASEGTLETASISSGVANLFLLSALFSIWLLANYVTTLHQFKSVWKVAGSLLALPLILALLVSVAAGAAPVSPEESLLP